METCQWCYKEIPNEDEIFETDGMIFCSEDCIEDYEEEERLKEEEQEQ